MSKVALNTIKNWFKTGLKPTQAQFWDTWDSFWHKDDSIAAENINGLPALFDAKADTEALQNHQNNEDAHGLATIRDNLQTLAQSVEEIEEQIAAPSSLTIVRYGDDVDADGNLDLSSEDIPTNPKPVVYVDNVTGAWQAQYNKQTKILSGLYGIDPDATIEIIF